MTFPTLTPSGFLADEIALPILSDDGLYLGTAGYDFGNHLSFGSLDEERYNAQVTASGEELYNTAINLGASNESIASGIGLGQALAGNVVGTNALAGAITGYDLGTNQMLTGMERLQEAAQGVSQVAGTLAGGLAISRGGALGSQCFTEGTQIVVGEVYDEELCTTDYVTENIEDIEIGDLVYSYDTVTSEVSQQEVTATFVLESDHINYLTIVDESGNEQVIETTDSHPFWVVTDEPDLERAARTVVDENGIILYHDNLESGLNGFWVEAKDLQEGDVFIGANGELSTLIATERVEFLDGIKVYNFTVNGNHNYFVIAETDEFGQTSILVHNADPCMYTGVVQKLSRDEMIPPTRPGKSPTSKKDGLPIELHHDGQRPDSPLIEMHATDHRFGENFKKNHSNTGQSPSNINRAAFEKFKRDYWQGEF